ncbi:uncharacterized protein YbjT (DUF2867 family) [Microbacterium terrae]|uniref:NAD(P)-binding domain-containing protein n=1 Tax=Microbacterium terrae TaxID=69369 RepID=A0A0M2GXV3_9MICO|nr:3-beta hydroxysteroid dehydrogenase [Microbacterium terrae]KJL38799.1 hypothetical protein RS81_02594 [Microbacterium terrae]MBP1076218.1 uncharacterized protein YbjT (DUF2867 family) [Microbacterium terrae]GLJ97039.1 nucleoside-diphosphate sugar epimerase [Microbacterium terrae]
MRIAIAGGSGLLGSHVTRVARERGHEPVVLSRRTGVDLVSGAGLAERLRGARAVIDVSNIQTGRPELSVSFFAGATANLLRQGRIAGVEHHIALTIVGMEAAPDGYYAGKLAQERSVSAGAVPWSILRATQFHEFPAMYYHRSAPVHSAASGRLQPVAAREVAERLVGLAESAPVGRAPDLAGPQEESLAAMIRAYAHAIGRSAPVPIVHVPGAYGRALRSGALLPGAGADRGVQTYAEWLDDLPDA